MNIIPKNWNTNRLSIADLTEHEVPIVQKIYQTSTYMNEWDGCEYDPNHIKKCLTEGNLPPEGILENYRIQTIRMTENLKTIGLISLYHGYPVEHSLYLEFLYIHGDVQKQGFGQEIIKGFSSLVFELGYKEIRINVSTKNWPALRYWIKSGFNKVNGIYGDPMYSETSFSNLELMMTL
ncbi:GNAT family N-acetyltransferase [Paenibacillus sp. Marseille-Q4541]|uniref:GNAT family N-acetyltransferase n=1 Tax=Paenibacillus sp. Marseille-Q4541 TaxID=2831522 RepID=UPI001BA4A4E5|nr:GNAT family N-acetyltransferase [Paenibacillus sp. Marseille-Q4541]